MARPGPAESPECDRLHPSALRAPGVRIPPGKSFPPLALPPASTATRCMIGNGRSEHGNCDSDACTYTDSIGRSGDGKTALSSKTITYEQLAKVIDHSLLRPELTEAEVIAGCELAARYHTATVCVRPSAWARSGQDSRAKRRSRNVSNCSGSRLFNRDPPSLSN